jgi:hypothetical protein
VLWEVVREAALRGGIKKLAPHNLRRYAEIVIAGAPAPVCATSSAANWIRFNSCSGTSRSKLGNDTSGATKSYASASMTDRASSQTLTLRKTAGGHRSPLGDLSFLIRFPVAAETCGSMNSRSLKR